MHLTSSQKSKNTKCIMGSKNTKYDIGSILYRKSESKRYNREQAFINWGQWWSIKVSEKEVMLSDMYLKKRSAVQKSRKINKKYKDQKGRGKTLFSDDINFYVVIPKEYIQ